MAISALGNIGGISDRLDEWSDFAGHLLGIQKIDLDGTPPRTYARQAK